MNSGTATVVTNGSGNKGVLACCDAELTSTKMYWFDIGSRTWSTLPGTWDLPTTYWGWLTSGYNNTDKQCKNKCLV